MAPHACHRSRPAHGLARAAAPRGLHTPATRPSGAPHDAATACSPWQDALGNRIHSLCAGHGAASGAGKVNTAAAGRGSGRGLRGICGGSGGAARCSAVPGPAWIHSRPCRSRFGRLITIFKYHVARIIHCLMYLKLPTNFWSSLTTVGTVPDVVFRNF